MYHTYIEHMKQFGEHAQKPIKELLTLQVRTLQKISYIKPDELKTFKKPEDFMDRQQIILFQNSHYFIDYMAQAFTIIEQHLLSLTKAQD